MSLRRWGPADLLRKVLQKDIYTETNMNYETLD